MDGEVVVASSHNLSIVLAAIVVFSQVFHHHTNLCCFIGLGMMKELWPLGFPKTFHHRSLLLLLL
jgi:hypothetical protein